MNSVIALCVGILGAANTANLKTETQEPVQVAYASPGIAAGGCYQKPVYGSGYGSPVVQGPATYPPRPANCPGGWCGTTTSANCANGQCGLCPNGQCRPLSHTAYTPANTANTANTANCPNGQCHQNGLYHTTSGTKCYGPNCPQQTPGTFYPTTGTRYNTLPATRYPAGIFAQPRSNGYSVPQNYNVNWTNTNRPTLPSSYSNSSTNSPFFE